MNRRWLIRSFFIALCLLCVGAWVGSHFMIVQVTHCQRGDSLELDVECGDAVFLYFNNLVVLRGGTWRWRQAPMSSAARLAHEKSYRASEHRFGGFSFYPDNGHYWGIRIPLYFPTLLSTLPLWFAWRKTRANYKRRGFPVEPAAKTS